MNEIAGKFIGQFAFPDNGIYCRILEKGDVPHIPENIEVEENFPANVSVGLGFNFGFGFAFSLGS